MKEVAWWKDPGFWIGMVVSVVSLAIILILVDVRAVVDALGTANYGLVTLSTLGVLAFMIVRAVRWRFMLSNEIDLSQIFHIQNIGYMLNNLLPFRAGDLARAVLVGSVPSIAVARGISTMVVERILDMLFVVALLPLTVIGLEGLPEWMNAAAKASGVLVVASFVILLAVANQARTAETIARFLLDRIPFLNTERWLQRTEEVLAGLSSLGGPREILILIVLSILVWLPIMFAYFVMMRAVHIQATWPIAGFTLCAAAFSVAAPSSPGQIGVFHAGVIAALTFLGQPETEAAGFAFLYHALAVIIMVALGVVGLAFTGQSFRQVIGSARGYGK